MIYGPIGGYLWARTVRCPYCFGLVPLSPNWRLAPGGVGVRIRPESRRRSGITRTGLFVRDRDRRQADQSPGTVARGTGTCPYPDCGHVIDGDEIKKQAQDGEMGEQLFVVVYKRRVKKYLKSGKRGKDRWVRGYRTPRPEDDNAAESPRSSWTTSCPNGKRWTSFRPGGYPWATRPPNRTAMECCSGATCSRPASCCVMAPASRCTARCWKRIERPGELTPLREGGVWVLGVGARHLYSTTTRRMSDVGTFTTGRVTVNFVRRGTTMLSSSGLMRRDGVPNRVRSWIGLGQSTRPPSASRELVDAPVAAP